MIHEWSIRLSLKPTQVLFILNQESTTHFSVDHAVKNKKKTEVKGK